jgi:predicted aldo/keto reductase-like oxidoreductase
MNRYLKKWRAGKKENGLCFHCGRCIAEPDRVRCVTCLRSARERLDGEEASDYSEQVSSCDPTTKET